VEGVAGSCGTCLDSKANRQITAQLGITGNLDNKHANPSIAIVPDVPNSLYNNETGRRDSTPRDPQQLGYVVYASIDLRGFSAERIL
jgi:hypothetical protein